MTAPAGTPVTWAPSEYSSAQTTLLARHEFEDEGCAMALSLKLTVGNEDVQLKVTRSFLNADNYTETVVLIDEYFGREEMVQFLALMAHASGRIPAHDAARAVAEGGATQ